MRRAAVLGVLLIALAVPSAAFAHASVQSTFPKYRQELHRAPASVRISFDQKVDALPNAIRVYDAHGRLFSHGVLELSGGFTVATKLSTLPKGAYTVRWQVISGDGHVVSGVYTFGMRVRAPEPLEAYGAGGPTTSEHVVRWLYFIGLALLLGGLAFRLLILPRELPPRLERRFFWITGIGVVGVLEVGIAAFLLRAEDALQLPFGRFVYGDLSPIAGGTRFGTAFIAMTLGFSVVAALLFLAWLTERRWLLWASFATGLGFASGLSLSGHSAVDRGASKWSELADWVHLSAASLWAGGVIMLVTVFVTERMLGRESFARFSRLAPVLIALLLGAGIYLSVLRVPTLPDLWQTGYGRVLMVKLGLVSLALAWGAAHHFIVRPRLQTAGRGVARSLLGESAVAMSILLAAAVLVDSKPPVPRPAQPAQALHARR